MKWAKKNRRMIITVVVIIVILLFIQFVVLDGKKVDAKMLSYQDGGIVPPDWTPDKITAELFDAIDGSDSQSKREAAFARFNGLNPNEKILVYNFWNKTYFNKRSWLQKHGSLTKALRDEWLKGDEGIKALGALEELNLP